MKCVDVNESGAICQEDYHGTVSGSSLCVDHIIKGHELAQRATGIKAIIHQLEQITVADVLALQEKVGPLMAMAGGGMAGAVPARCTKTVGCLMMAGHGLDCSTNP